MGAALAQQPARSPLVLSGLLAAVFTLQLAAILIAADGSFTYALDDPYIHLALADQLCHLHYGINPGEPATPSSSVLWPFLLVPTAGTALHGATPLVINVVPPLVSLLPRIAFSVLRQGEVGPSWTGRGLIWSARDPAAVLPRMKRPAL